MGGWRRSPLVQRVERQRDLLADRILGAVTGQLPAYARLGHGELDDLEATIHHGLGVIFRLLREGGTFTPAELAVFEQSAARRAHEEVSLGALLGAYHLSSHVTWKAFRAAAGTSDQQELLGMAEQTMTKGPTVIAAVATAFVDERLRLGGDPASARHALAEALVRGLPAAELAMRAGVALAPSYLAVALAIRDAVGAPGGMDGVSPRRRALGELEQWLAEDRDGDALGLLTERGGTLLLTVTGRAGDGASFDVPVLRRLDQVAGVEVTAATAWRPTRAELPAAVEEAREVLQLAVATGRPPGVYRLDDVLVEAVLAQPSVVAERLVRLLVPLAEGPALLQTLDGYLAADLDRRQAARALHIHPNTLDYRLRRIRELTGLSPTTTHGLQVLSAALTAWRLRGAARG